MSSTPGKTWLLAAGVVLSNLAGNTLLSYGMRDVSGAGAFLSPSTLGGIALLILWTVSRATLLSWADLSFVLPVTAIGYVLTAITGAVFLDEQVTPTRWAATLLIVAGVILAGTTSAQTTRGGQDNT